jgi:hypothetical protein
VTHRHAVVWLDHAQARVFELSPENVKCAVIHAHADPHGAAHGSPRVHHKANVIGPGKVQTEPKFFGQVAAALEAATEILLLGPGVAKNEFLNHVKAHAPSVARRIVQADTADRMTDNQVVAQGRAFFHGYDQMHPHRSE